MLVDKDTTVVVLSPPGRFPTVVYDPGAWWSELATTFSVSHLTANVRWWEFVCSPAVARMVKPAFRRWPGVNLERSGTLAAEALRNFRRAVTYLSIEQYTGASSALARHLTALNSAQDELTFSLASGARVLQLNYGNSKSLVEYAKRVTLFSRLTERVLGDAKAPINLLVVSVNSPEELLSALSVVCQLRHHHPQMHACLADHGYENFSLSPHLDKLRSAGTLDSVFDSIIEAKDDRDWILPRLARQLAAGTARRGFLRRRDFPEIETAFVGPPKRYVPPPVVPVFVPEPVFSTRVSARRCYWSKCTFCVQNNKYDAPETPSLAGTPAALDQLAALSKAGYRNIVLNDEALAPSLLENLSRGLIDRRIEISWCCRAKLELAFRPALFRLMRQAGCCEVLVGLESISQRMQKRMNKYVAGLTRERIKTILQDAGAARIGVHVNLIAGFPGDTPAEVMASVDFLVETLQPLPHATFALNRFVLFPGSPVAMRLDFGIEALKTDDDMPYSYSYSPAPALVANALEIDRLLPALRRRLASALGWDRIGDGLDAQPAQWLYFSSGHGLLFKKQPDSIFCNPLRSPAVMAQAEDESAVLQRCLGGLRIAPGGIG